MSPTKRAISVSGFSLSVCTSSGNGALKLPYRARVLTAPTPESQPILVISNDDLNRPDIMTLKTNVKPFQDQYKANQKSNKCFTHVIDRLGIMDRIVVPFHALKVVLAP